MILDAEDSEEEKRKAWGRPDAFRWRGLNSLLRRRDARHQGRADDGSDSGGHTSDSHRDCTHRCFGRCIMILSVGSEGTCPNDYKGL